MRRHGHFVDKNVSWILQWLVFLFVVPMFAACGTAHAQELLSNPSFEAPAAPANGNNFYTSIPVWTVTSDTGQSNPSNIVVPWSGYAGNPIATPSGGGRQYFDVNASSGTLRQTVTLAAPGVFDFSAWFSVRDNQQALAGMSVNIRNAANAIIATANTSFQASDPIGLWKKAAASNIPLEAGSYTFEIILPNPANVDLASMTSQPPLSVSKSVTAYSDPVNGQVNPKLIPGGVAEFAIVVENTATYTVASDTLAVADATPAGAQLMVADITATGSGPASFAEGVSGLAFNFAGFADANDDVEFSNDGGVSWNYVPVAGANGADPAVSHIRMRPKGAMNPSSSFTFRLRYLIR